VQKRQTAPQCRARRVRLRIRGLGQLGQAPPEQLEDDARLVVFGPGQERSFIVWILFPSGSPERGCARAVSTRKRNLGSGFLACSSRRRIAAGLQAKLAGGPGCLQVTGFAFENQKLFEQARRNRSSLGLRERTPLGIRSSGGRGLRQRLP